MNIDNLDKTLNKIKIECAGPDLNIKLMETKKIRLATIYLETITSTSEMNDVILKNISDDFRHEIKFKDVYNYLYNSISCGSINTISSYKEIIEYLYNGFAVVLIDKSDKAIVCEARATLDRGVSTPSSEAIIRGPKDGFTENFNKNLGLIRRRIKSPDLKVIEKNCGRLSKTRIGVMYISTIADKHLVDDIIKKIDQIDIDAILDSGYLRELIIDDNKSNFPTIMSSERPDKASMALLDGRVVLIFDNTPFVLIIPTFFIDYFHTPEDYYQKSNNVSFIRIIRFIAFFLSILTPAIYIALVTHNQKNIPTGFLVNFASQRIGVPFPSFVEALIMMIAFEILRESDIRLPSIGGSSVSILGGIIIGDAAVSAGIVSPIMVIVISITAISSLIFSQVDVISAIRTYRIIFLIAATIFGIYGIILLSILLIIRLTSLEVFNIPFTYPFAPFNLKEQNDTLIRAQRKKLQFRNFITAKKNIRRIKKES